MPLLSSLIYRRDALGRLRTWRYEVDGDRWRTHAGLDGGAIVTSGWTVCSPKSRPTAEEQAVFEARAAEDHKLTRRYHRTPEECATPNFFAPMLAKKYEDFAPKGRLKFPLYEQPKLDGMRCVATVEGLFSRQGKEITSCPHVREALEPLFREDPDLILDGELYNHDLRNDFERLISHVRKVASARRRPGELETALAECAAVVQYHVYDAPSLEGDFDDRYESLYSALSDRLPGAISCSPPTPIRLVFTTYCRDQSTLDARAIRHAALGYEGQMVRTLGVPYEVGRRSASLLKRKDFQDVEVTIERLIEGEGNWSGYAKSVEYRLDSGATLESGDLPCAGIAGTQEFCAELLRDAEDWRGRRCTIKFQKLSARGIPIFPIAVKFHDDVGEPGRD